MYDNLAQPEAPMNGTKLLYYENIEGLRLPNEINYEP